KFDVNSVYRIAVWWTRNPENPEIPLDPINAAAARYAIVQNTAAIVNRQIIGCEFVLHQIAHIVAVGNEGFLSVNGCLREEKRRCLRRHQTDHNHDNEVQQSFGHLPPFLSKEDSFVLNI